MLEPLLQHLSNLSSADFYQELKTWKNTVETGLHRVESESVNSSATINDRSNADVDDERVEDLLAILDPSDAIATAKLMDALEMTSDGCSTGGGTDDDEVPPTQPTQLKLEPLQQQISTPTESDVDIKRSKEDVCNDPPPPARLSPTATPVRQVDIITVPKPKGRGRARSKKKQLRQTKLTPGPNRLAVHKYPSGLSVPIDQLVTWARNTASVKDVVEMMERYPVQLEDAYLRARTVECQWEAVRPEAYMHNFVIPIDLTRSMQAAATTARNEQHKPDKLEGRVKKHGIVLELVVSIDTKLWKFSR
ncbi:hypothetical protein PHYPSEUDO_012324 [Phytophthora pseudosyringae]|uniref:Uncharacterized protein n=1 Tax=Phytophthora pseudosyringae TaxID=221518 RepID=A0A8T1V6V4_9STRA|nr:hypothetical protein PHYPSEUDO_012324 [Phytophthora pseudosyringae]